MEKAGQMPERDPRLMPRYQNHKNPYSVCTITETPDLRVQMYKRCMGLGLLHTGGFATSG